MIEQHMETIMRAAGATSYRLSEDTATLYQRTLVGETEVGCVHTGGWGVWCLTVTGLHTDREVAGSLDEAIERLAGRVSGRELAPGLVLRRACGGESHHYFARHLIVCDADRDITHMVAPSGDGFALLDSTGHVLRRAEVGTLDEAISAIARAVTTP
jgi:hypothetical protein